MKARYYNLTIDHPPRGIEIKLEWEKPFSAKIFPALNVMIFQYRTGVLLAYMPLFLQEGNVCLIVNAHLITRCALFRMCDMSVICGQTLLLWCNSFVSISLVVQ